MLDKYLPIGSVVRLSGGTKNVMIYGRRQRSLADNREYDYISCLYPEGNISEEHMYLFNHEQIERVFFMGYQDDEEIAFARVLAAVNDDSSSSPSLDQPASEATHETPPRSVADAF